jgi:uncharacterized membrane protein
VSKQRANKPPNPPSRREARTAITTQIEESSFSGPIPPPAILEEYDRIIPGAAERILRMAEADAQFQRDITLSALGAEAAEVKRGQILGFLIGTFALLIATVALYLSFRVNLRGKKRNLRYSQPYG